MGLDLGWSVRLREALQKNELTVHYQPIVSLNDIDATQLPDEDGKLWEHILQRLPNLQHHYEALIRLRGHDGEVISPAAFLPSAERFNMMRELDRWVIQHTLRELKATVSQRPDTVFAINLSGTSVGDDTLLPTIKALLAEHNIDPRTVIFEITETAAIENLDEARTFIRELSALGCRFALDDFGSGFSSFAHLKHLNVHFIKIDGAFIQGVASNLVDRSIVTSINDVAHALGKRTIAEYVQNADVLRVLKECGVDYVQGYYIARPLEMTREKSSDQGDNAQRVPLSA
jgi:EAL domain-containing protein (putative c-di-GMP-specific phosphodiesterase class I)